MGCLEIIFLCVIGCVLISMFFFVIEAAVLATLGILVFGGIGFLVFGAAGLKVGAVIGLLVGIYWAIAG